MLGLTQTLIYLLVFVAGALLGFIYAVLKRPECENDDRSFKLIMSIQLDATQPIKINAKGRDKEGNQVNLDGTDLVITAEATNGNFGEVNDEMDTFNPGDAGATGVLKGTVTVDDKAYEASVEVELVAGGLDSIELEFAPVAE